MSRSVEIEREDRDVVVPPEELIIAAAGYGRWQIFITVILCMTIFMHMLNSNLEPIQHMTGWWCEKPDVLRSWTTSQWIRFSHVNATRRGFDAQLKNERFRGCYIYKYNFSKLLGTSYEQRPEIQNREPVLCKKIHYTQTFGRTFAEKFGKGCDPDYQDSLWHAFILLGEALGYVTFGYLSDRVGRKRVLFIACGMTPLTAIAIAFAPIYAVFIVAQTMHNFFHGGFVASFIMVIELSNNIWRTRATALAVLAYALGIGVTPICLKAVKSLELLTLLINVPYILFFLAIRFIPESPAWLFCTRSSTQLQQVIKNASKMNDTLLPHNFRVIYIEYTDVEKQLPKTRPGFWNLLQAPEVACEITGIGYLVALSAIANGSSQAKLVFNEKRVNRWYFIIGLDAMASIMISQFCVLMMGHRKLLHIAVFLILITTAIMMVNLREDYFTTTGPATTLLAANVFAVNLSYGDLLNYSSRTVPTLIRGTYLGIWSALWVSFTWAGTHRYLNYPGISSVAVITILLAALATLNIRDLLWRELPDTVSDAVNFKDKPKPKRWALTETQLTGGYFN